MRRTLPLLALVVGLAACPPAGRYAVVAKDLPCDRATRVAHRTMVSLGFEVDALTEATPGRSGRISGTRPRADGTRERGSVNISCGEDEVILQPVEGELVPSSWDFSRSFGYSFTTLESRPDQETPAQEVGLQILLEVVTEAAAQLELGAPAVTAAATLLRVTVRNHTPRPLDVDAERLGRVSPNGDPETALAGSELARVMLPGPGADAVRANLLGRTHVPANETVVRFLVFPPGSYREANVTILDTETSETEGFLVQVR
jgi:hypothetical protein